MAKRKNQNRNNQNQNQCETKTINNDDQEQKNNSNEEQKDNSEENKKSNEGGGNKGGNISVNVIIFKIDLHCEGCASRISKRIRSVEGVESVKLFDGDLTKIKVVGSGEPAKLREKIEQKTKKKVEIISPSTKKDKENANKENEKSSNGDDKNKNSGGDKSAKQSDDKKSKEKELPVTTAVLKVQLHCEGCIQKIHKFVSKTKGFMEMTVDIEKDLVTVKGAIDMKALEEAMKKKLKKNVEIVPAKKGKNDGGGGGGGDGGGKVEGNKMVQSVEYGYPVVYGPCDIMFSDENANSCVVM